MRWPLQKGPLDDAIKRSIKAHNKNARPFVCVASAASIFEKRADASEPKLPK
jgi:hypothetical protein